MDKVYLYDVFLICPVRNATDEQKQQLQDYIIRLENEGLKIYYPARDTDQNDPTGYRICMDNRYAISYSREIWIYWDKDSSGSLFDLGMAFMENKPLFIINHENLEKTSHKSFANMIIEWEQSV